MYILYRRPSSGIELLAQQTNPAYGAELLIEVPRSSDLGGGQTNILPKWAGEGGEGEREAGPEA